MSALEIDLICTNCLCLALAGAVYWSSGRLIRRLMNLVEDLAAENAALKAALARKDSE